MTSLLTNMSAMSALQNLSATQKSLTKTQAEISSGLSVSSASDNAAYWSISTIMKSDTGALSSVTDALNLGSSTVGVATAALNTTLTVLNQLKKDLVTAQTPGTDKSQIQTDIAAQQKSLIGTLSSAAFNGVNLLDGTAGTNGAATFVSSFSRSPTGTIAIGTIKVVTAGTGSTQLSGKNGILATSVGTLAASVQGAAGTAATGGAASQNFAKGSLLAFDITSATAADLTTLSTAVDSAISKVTTVGAQLGATKTNIDSQSAFVSSLSDAITAGVGSLEDADMNVASTKLQALQTQQQLGIQSLSIANQNSQLILKLFG